MFSSLASFIFGSNTSATTNSEANHHQPIGQRVETPHNRRISDDQDDHDDHDDNDDDGEDDDNLERFDAKEADHFINVTSTTPSVAGYHPNECISIREQDSGRNSQSQGGKRNKGKRNKIANRNKRNQSGHSGPSGQKAATKSLAKLLTPNESCDEDLDEDDWYIVEKEDEDESLPRTDSEEEISVVEVKSNNNSNTNATSTEQLTIIANAVQQQQQQQQQEQQQHHHHHHRQHINSHSLYSGPRPQQQRNLLQRARNNARSGVVSLNVSTLSPPRNIIDAGINAGIGGKGTNAPADIDCITQSLYVARPQVSTSMSLALSLPLSVNGNDNGTNIGMDESWFVTPPPCFTSLGPINMETSPYENLLIEHPSMSVYHSIRSAQEAAESFVNLDLGVGESQQMQRSTVTATVSAAVAVEAANNGRNAQVVTQQSRNPTARTDRFSAAQLKQELFARSTQKCQDKKERQNLCRGAIKRGNKVRDFQSKANRQRRSDMQHCRILSGANNNRKCCF